MKEYVKMNYNQVTGRNQEGSKENEYRVIWELPEVPRNRES
jgi:hypothetical protein